MDNILAWLFAENPDFGISPASIESPRAYTSFCSCSSKLTGLTEHQSSEINPSHETDQMLFDWDYMQKSGENLRPLSVATWPFFT